MGPVSGLHGCLECGAYRGCIRLPQPVTLDGVPEQADARQPPAQANPWARGQGRHAGESARRCGRYLGGPSRIEPAGIAIRRGGEGRPYSTTGTSRQFNSRKLKLDDSDTLRFVTVPVLEPTDSVVPPLVLLVKRRSVTAYDSEM